MKIKNRINVAQYSKLSDQCHNINYFLENALLLNSGLRFQFLAAFYINKNKSLLHTLSSS